MSHQCLKCLPKYVNYDWISINIEKCDLKKCRSPPRCLDGFYSELYVEQKTSHLGS